MSATSIKDISDELLLHVLSYVPSLDLLRNGVGCSRRWNDLICNESFWLHHRGPASLSFSTAATTSSDDEDKNSSAAAIMELMEKQQMWKQLSHHQRQRCSLFQEWFRSDQERNKEPSSRKTDEQAESMMSLRTTSSARAIGTAPSFLHFGSILPSRSVAIEWMEDSVLEYNADRPRVCCIATTTDNQRIERIENVLDDDNDNNNNNNNDNDDDDGSDDNQVMSVRQVLRRLSRRRRRAEHNHFMPEQVSWWSSAATRAPQATETLVFCTKSPRALVTSIAMKPLRDPYGQPQKCYTWDQTRISLYQIPTERLFLQQQQQRGTGAANADTDAASIPAIPQNAPCSFAEAHNSNNANHSQPTLQALLQGHEPVYTTPALNMMRNRDDMLYHDIVLPAATESNTDMPSSFVVANVIVLELIGKHTEQRTGSGDFYACVESVQAKGIPLGAP